MTQKNIANMAQNFDSNPYSSDSHKVLYENFRTPAYYQQRRLNPNSIWYTNPTIIHPSLQIPQISAHEMPQYICVESCLQPNFISSQIWFKNEEPDVQLMVTRNNSQESNLELKSDDLKMTKDLPSNSDKKWGINFITFKFKFKVLLFCFHLKFNFNTNLSYSPDWQRK